MPSLVCGTRDHIIRDETPIKALSKQDCLKNKGGALFVVPNNSNPPATSNKREIYLNDHFYLSRGHEDFQA